MRRLALLSLLSLAALAAACKPAQTDFTSAPPPGGGRGGAPNAAAGGDASGGRTNQTPTTQRTVEETDLYRLEGNRLYYLNSYRGLMVFDVTDVDHPKLLGRSAIYGYPVDMIVRNGVATVVVGDWYGTDDQGAPFYGSVVRGLDASDPTNIKVLGEARLPGWVRDDRVVGDVLYAVSEDAGWGYGWYAGGDVATAGAGGGSATAPQPKVVVSSVSFAGGKIQAVDKEELTGYSGVFHVTANAILAAHAVSDATYQAKQTELLYVDISDPAGHMTKRGAFTVDGVAQGWGADNGRWNLDFADGKTAHVIGCAVGSSGYCDGTTGYILSTVDFSLPDAPALRSSLDVAGTGWSVTSRFVGTRLYLSPDAGYNNNGATPFQVYDLSNPSAPALAGSTTIPGTVWNILPASDTKLFALGNDWQSGQSGEQVSLKYLDVTDATKPDLLGTAAFGDGWAWTPAAGTFKAFTWDAGKGLVVLPFSGWNEADQSYLNGLQLIQVSSRGIATAGTAHTRGWVERGIFVGTRLVSLSDEALAVIDYTDPAAPKVVSETVLARNVIAALPIGTNVVEVSSDWWGNDVSSSEVRLLPLANAEESTDLSGVPSLRIDGVNARVFSNGTLLYLISDVRLAVACPTGGSGCTGRAQRVQVVDVASGTPVLRGSATLPTDSWSWWWGGFYGCYFYDWYWGSEVVQVGKDALAFRRWQPVYDANGNWLDDNTLLYVVDLADADAPTLASTTIVSDPTGWWGNMKVIGETLYTTHYEWVQQPGPSGNGLVKYYLDRIDLSDRAHPVVGAKINVPGLLVGGSESDPTLLYTIDYTWSGNGNSTNLFDVIRVQGTTASLLSSTPIDGYVGRVFVQGSHALFSAESWDATGNGGDKVALHDLDLSNTAAPVDRTAAGQKGWGWLVAVEGDRALMTSGWGGQAVDLYLLADGKAPKYSQTVRTNGWGVSDVARQGAQLFLASGYWGIQAIALQ